MRVRKGNEIACHQTNSDASQTQMARENRSSSCGKQRSGETECASLRAEQCFTDLSSLSEMRYARVAADTACELPCELRECSSRFGRSAVRGKVPVLERADSGKRTTGPGTHFGQALTLCCLACLHGNEGKMRSAQIPKSRECIFSRLTCTISLSGTASRHLHPHFPYPTYSSRISHRCRLEYRSDSSCYNPQTPWTSTQFRDP